jgi:hypothetical protein
MVNTNAASIEVSDVLRTLQSYSMPNEAIGCLVPVVAYLVVRHPQRPPRSLRIDSMLRELRLEITSVQSHL